MTFRKGQSSIETLMVFVLVMFILVIIAIFANERNKEANEIKTLIDIRRICDSFSDNVNNIAEQGSGFYKYFRLPGEVYGKEEYWLNVYGNLVEVSSRNYSVINSMVSSNITIACLDKNLTKRNKVYNDGERIYIICDKPELYVLNDSLWPPNAYANTTVNVTVKVVNFGPADAGSFTVLFNNTTPVVVSSLKSEDSVEVGFNMATPLATGPYPIMVVVDSLNEVNESIEVNNNYTGTLNVVSKT